MVASVAPRSNSTRFPPTGNEGPSNLPRTAWVTGKHCGGRRNLRPDPADVSRAAKPTPQGRPRNGETVARDPELPREPCCRVGGLLRRPLPRCCTKVVGRASSLLLVGSVTMALPCEDPGGAECVCGVLGETGLLWVRGPVAGMEALSSPARYAACLPEGVRSRANAGSTRRRRPYRQGHRGSDFALLEPRRMLAVRYAWCPRLLLGPELLARMTV